MSHSTSSKPTLLVVDDHEENIQMLAVILSFMGYDLIPAMSGQEALSRMEHTTPDLILLDIILPDLDGIEVCNRIRKNPAWRDIPIIFLSAADDKNLIVKALESGGMDYITKPFNKAELISRVRTHLNLKEARDHLAELASDKDEMLRILAHDFKNHVAGAEMSTSLLIGRLEDVADERSSRLLHNLNENSTRMLQFLKNFLANHQVLSSATELHPLNLSQVLQQIVSEAEPVATAKGIVIISPDPAETAIIIAHLDGVRQALENLISNSLKFCAAGAEVRIEFVKHPLGRQSLRISDTGPGFTEEDRTKLFERYARLSAKATGGEPGSGLGLFIVKKMMQAMGGSVELEPGQGASFLLTFQRPNDSSQ